MGHRKLPFIDILSLVLLYLSFLVQLGCWPSC